MPTVLYDKRGRTVVLTLNRPEAMNALNTEVRNALRESFLRFRDDEDARTLIITGAGDNAFSAGADLKEMSLLQRQKRVDPAGLTLVTVLRNIELWKPIIAAVNGYCLAGGLELALSCDIRIASDNATFALTEVTRGLIPGNGGTQLLPRVVPAGIALELMFTGERISAEEAHEWGLVEEVADPGHAFDAAMALAAKVAAQPPLSVAMTKLTVNRLAHALDDLASHMDLDQFALASFSEDHKEGVAAFLGRRKPRFKGR